MRNNEKGMRRWRMMFFMVVKLGLLVFVCATQSELGFIGLEDF
jgi:hypothetical protein